jgi:hypothetical protein
MNRLGPALICLAPLAIAGVAILGSHLRTRDRVATIERGLVRPAPVVAAPDHTYELAVQHEAIRQLAIAVQVLGAECNPRRVYAPLHMPKGFDITHIEFGGDERPRGFVTGGAR